MHNFPLLAGQLQRLAAAEVDPHGLDRRASCLDLLPQLFGCFQLGLELGLFSRFQFVEDVNRASKIALSGSAPTNPSALVRS